MKTLLVAIPILMLLASSTVQSAPHRSLDDPTTALLIIDIQDFYFPGGSLPLIDPESASSNASCLLKAFRDRGLTIAHVGHQVKTGGEFHPDVAPLPDEIVVMKTEVNAFLGTDLLKLLQEAGIKNLVICGMQTHMCLEGATRAAADHGFRCVVIADACATRDLKRGDVVVPADGVHNSTLATLDGVYAQVIDTATFLGDD